MSGITVTRRGDRLLATKITDPTGAPRRHHESDLLQQLRHPGVVEFVALDEGPPLALHTGFVGPDTWSQRPPADDRAIVEGLTAVASTVADLHDLGTAHRALSPDHVLVAADGRPVLCGLADSTTADDPAVFDDLQGLAALIERLRAHASPELATRLEELARRADRGGLTARALAAELAAVGPPPPTSRSRRRALRTGRVPATVLIGLAAITLAGWFMVGPSSKTSGGVERTQPRDPRQVTLPEPPPPSTVAARSRTDRSPPGATDPLVIEHGGRRYGVGRADHIAVVGDWRCAGSATPAVLDPSSGVIAIFDTWPAPGSEVAAAHTVAVPDAIDLRIDPDTCGQLRVVQPTGSTLLAPALP